MKRFIIIVLASTFLYGCSEDRDCGCDRVIETHYTDAITVVPPGTPPAYFTTGSFITEDECGNRKTWYVDQSGIYEVGQCKD